MMSVMQSDASRCAAHVKSKQQFEDLYRKSLDHPVDFWLAYTDLFFWKNKPSKEEALTYNFDVRKGAIFVKWFADGVTNICYNILDKNVEHGLGDKIAFHWEGNNPEDHCTVTYSELLNKVQRFGLALKSLGVTKGDFVAIYMPMVPEIVVAMLACARIGAVHSVVFGGFSALALATRITDAKCKFLVTCDVTWRGAKSIDLLESALSALEICGKNGHSVHHCIVLRRVISSSLDSGSVLNGSLSSTTQQSTPSLNSIAKLQQGRDIWWHDFLDGVPDKVECPVEWLNAEDPSFILYTSGSTGKPKGIVHTVGGYMVYAATTFYYTFDYHPDDVFWCTADAGWITGHSYVIYGPMLNGATSVIYEGIPTWPDCGRCWAIVDRYQVTKFYTAPTAIRTLIAAGDEFVLKYERTSLKVLGSVGEPINPSAWEWYYNVVGGGRCSIVDTFWQTETGGHMITALPGVSVMKPGSASQPFFGVDARIISESGEDLSEKARASGTSLEGYLVFAKPWPGMMRTIHGDHQRFQDVYFSQFPGYYLTGDGARMDEDGDFWITGRIDDMLNVSGHLISTAEVESTILLHRRVAEAAAVSRAHPVKGECLHCFITLKVENAATCNSVTNGAQHCALETLRSEIADLVRKKIGPFAIPDHLQVTTALPKTRSGKVLRRVLRKIANMDFDLGDTSTIADQSCIDELIAQAKLG